MDLDEKDIESAVKMISSLSLRSFLPGLWLLSLASICEGSVTVVNISESEGDWTFDCPDQAGNDGGGGWIFTQGSDCTTSAYAPVGKVIQSDDWLPGYSVYGLLDGEGFYQRMATFDGGTNTTEIVDCQVTYPKGCFCDYDTPNGGCPIVEKLPDVVIPKPTEFTWFTPTTISTSTMEVKLQVRCAGQFEFCFDESYGGVDAYFKYSSIPMDAENYTYAMDTWECTRTSNGDFSERCVLACSPGCECTELQNGEPIALAGCVSVQNGYDTEAPTMAPTPDTMSPTTSPSKSPTTMAPSSAAGTLVGSWILMVLGVLLVSTTLN